jgi:hypothetical protein
LFLWERFGWGKEQTDKLTTADLRKIFVVLEQRRVSQDAMENLGTPDPSRIRSKIQQANKGLKTATTVNEDGTLVGGARGTNVDPALSVPQASQATMEKKVIPMNKFAIVDEQGKPMSNQKIE